MKDNRLAIDGQLIADVLASRVDNLYEWDE